MSGKRLIVGIAAVVVMVGMSGISSAIARAADTDTTVKLKPQTVCPIMGGEINKDFYVDAAGYRFYVCCPSCSPKIAADPAKALATLKAKGEKPALHLVVCQKCGEIKGTGQCCRADAEKCGCGMNKGSIGCCKGLKPAVKSGTVAVCTKCGEFKGDAKCCQADAKKCGCGMNKGSVGCCQKLPKTTADNDVVICPNCGEVDGTQTCCKKDVAKCGKCGLHKGSPGCCKIDRFIKDDV